MINNYLYTIYRKEPIPKQRIPVHKFCGNKYKNIF